MKLTMKLSCAALLVAIFTAPLLGHHLVAANYDASKAITIQGTITKVEWNNPHVSLWMNVTGSDGTIAAWQIQLAATGALGRAGFDKSFFDLMKSFSMESGPLSMDQSMPTAGR